MIIVLSVAFCIISEIGCYKFIKHLDKKERAKLQKWENRYIDSKKEETEKYLEMQALKMEEKKKKEEALTKKKAEKEANKK